MGLFTPKWMSDDRSKALKAVEKITDPQKLAEVAVNAKDQFVISKAIESIQEEAVLAGITLGNVKYFPIMKALERVTNPDLLKLIADEAELNWVRIAALSRLKTQNHNFDLLPYNDLIKECVKAGNSEAANLCKNRFLLEDVYRLNRPRWLMDKNQWSIMHSFEARINQLASECIRDTQLPSGLKQFIEPGNIYSDEVHNAAQAKLNAILLPENTSQEELYMAALNNPAVREKALSRISDPEFLGKIARNAEFSPQVRVKYAEKAGIGNPFGTNTLVCPKCGKPAVYREMYESIDSWKIEAEFRCQKYDQGCELSTANNPLRSFAIGEADINWKDKLIFICSSCGKIRTSSDNTDVSAFMTRCDCGSIEVPIPVEYQFG